MTASQLDLEAVLQAMPPGVDVDPRGTTCWWVLVDGDQIGWVRLTTRGRYTATVPGWRDHRWKERRGRNAARADFDDFAAAVRFVSDNRDNYTTTRGRGRGRRT